MVKITHRGLVPPDDPMFSSSYQLFSHRKSKPSTKSSPKSTISAATPKSKGSYKISTKRPGR